MMKFPLNDIPKLNIITGVYVLVNILNNHKYIGSSINIRKRIFQHRSALRSNKHHSRHLQNAYNKYGEDKFEIMILETCEPIKDTLEFLEQKYLDLKPEYNVAPKAYIPDATQNRKRVYMYDLQGKYIKTFDCRESAASWLGLKSNGMSIFYCCAGKIKSAYGYMWSYQKISNLQKYKRRYSASRKVCMCDDNWNIIREYDSIKEAATNLGKTICRINISACLSGKRKHAFGYKWKYSDSSKNKL